MYKIDIDIENEYETKRLGAAIANIAEPTDVFAFFGTLGMGKSVLARAFIRELTSSDEEVPSPTFTLVQTYEAQKAILWHFDLYRIKQAEEVFELGIEDAFADGISLIEWPEKMSDYLPMDRYNINIIGIDEKRRKIEIMAPLFASTKVNKLKELAKSLGIKE